MRISGLRKFIETLDYGRTGRTAFVAEHGKFTAEVPGTWAEDSSFNFDRARLESPGLGRIAERATAQGYIIEASKAGAPTGSPRESLTNPRTASETGS